jgi:hypothetical protein
VRLPLLHHFYTTDFNERGGDGLEAIIPGRYRGQSTNRRIDILLRSEPVTGIVSGKEPVERTPDHELAGIPILSDKEALKVSPGTLVDLRQSA